MADIKNLKMSSSADIRVNGDGIENGHDHILRPRAVKPGNPAVLRARSEDSYSGHHSQEGSEHGSHAPTR